MEKGFKYSQDHSSIKCNFSSIIYFRHNAVVLRVMLKFSSMMYLTLSTTALPPAVQLYVVAIKHKINDLGELGT